jgi:hypothetical protein
MATSMAAFREPHADSFSVAPVIKGILRFPMPKGYARTGRWGHSY